MKFTEFEINLVRFAFESLGRLNREMKGHSFSTTEEKQTEKILKKMEK